MAVQFPNFLNVPVRTPDYSGIADIVQNYYAGKAMPKDDMMKAIQAEFARPNAEQSLLSSKLSNRKSQMEIDKMAADMAEQAAFQKQLSQALQGNRMPVNTPMDNAGQNGLPLPPVRNMPPIGASPMQTSRAAGIPGVNIVGDASADSGIDITKMDPRFRKYDRMATGLPLSAYTNKGADANNFGGADASAAPAQPATVAPKEAEPEFTETVISKGSPHLAGVDQLWETNPRARPFLEKQGYKKTQEIKFDNKSGKTTILTTLPSGTVTMKVIGGAALSGGDGIPLTNKMVSAHQEKIAAIDTAVPVIKEIIDQKGFQAYPRSFGMGLVPGWMGQSATYNALVKSALDTLIKAYGLPSTNEGISTVQDQLLIGHGETGGHYRGRLKNLLKDLQRRKEYSQKEVKRSNKMSPVDSSAGSGENYSADDWEAV